MHRTRRRWRSPAITALLALVLATAASTVALTPTAGANGTDPGTAVTGATLTWTVSENAWTGGSLSASHGTEAPATRTDDGFAFTAGGGTYDPATGAAAVDFEGALLVGNETRGGYRIRFADPSIRIDADGNGTLTADVGYCLPGNWSPMNTGECNGADYGGSTDAYTVGGQDDAVVASFTGATATDTGATVSWTITPDTDDVPADAPPAFEGAKQFASSLIAALAPAEPSLIGHFRQTSADGPDAPANLGKLPAPFTLELTYEAGPDPVPSGPTIAVDPSAGLDPAGDTVTVSGSGFARVGVYVRTCVAVEGAVGTPVARPTPAQCDADRQLWVGDPHFGAPTPMGEDGTFAAPLAVSATLTNDAGDTIDCTAVACGIFVRRDHLGGGADLSYDSFTPIAFATPGPGPEPGPGPDPDPGTTGTIVGGELEWGIKQSFRNYIVGPIAHGTVTVDAPATQAPGNGTFTFPVAGDGTFGGADDIAAAFAGSVRLYGHDGAMDVTIADPQVSIDGASGRLLVDLVANERDSDAVHHLDDLVVATLDLSGVQATVAGDAVTLAGIPATVTAEGEVAFSGQYAAGEPLDPLTLVLQVTGADLGGLDPTDPEADVVGCVPGTATAGSPIGVCGGGFLPGEQVQVVLHSTPVTLGVLTAGDDGAVRGSVTIPATTEAGTHEVELLGISSGRSIRSAALTVAAAASPSPTGAGTGTGTLPLTGSGTTRLAALGVALLVAGGALRLAGNRRRGPATS